jgi:hypothetical protein
MRGKEDQEQWYTVQYSDQPENLIAPTANNKRKFAIRHLTVSCSLPQPLVPLVWLVYWVASSCLIHPKDCYHSAYKMFERLQHMTSWWAEADVTHYNRVTFIPTHPTFKAGRCLKLLIQNICSHSGQKKYHTQKPSLWSYLYCTLHSYEGKHTVAPSVLKTSYGSMCTP